MVEQDKIPMTIKCLLIILEIESGTPFRFFGLSCHNSMYALIYHQPKLLVSITEDSAIQYSTMEYHVFHSTLFV